MCVSLCKFCVLSQVRPYNADRTKNMRNLNPEDIDQLITVTGMVIRASDLIPELSEGWFRCSVCHYMAHADVERGRIQEPVLCPNCNTNHSFGLIHNRSKFSDKQMIKLQESPDDMPAGQTPHTVVLFGEKLVNFFCVRGSYDGTFIYILEETDKPSVFGTYGTGMFLQ